jgi:hypothetical protein
MSKTAREGKQWVDADIGKGEEGKSSAAKQFLG